MDIRKSLNYMRIAQGSKTAKTLTETKSNVSMRDLLGKMRKLNEDTYSKPDKGNNQNDSFDIAPISKSEQEREEKKFLDFMRNNNVNIEFEEMIVYDNAVFWGGTIDGQIQWVFKVTPNEETSGIEVNYLDGFDASNEENDEINKKIEVYYDSFYKYWRDNELNITKS